MLHILLGNVFGKCVIVLILLLFAFLTLLITLLVTVLLIAFFAMLKVGLVGGSAVPCDWVHGLAVMFACLPIALGGWISAISQGKTSAACIQMIAKQPGEAGKAVILPAMVETYAVLALLVSILLMNGIAL